MNTSSPISFSLSPVISPSLRLAALGYYSTTLSLGLIGNSLLLYASCQGRRLDGRFLRQNHAHGNFCIFLQNTAFNSLMICVVMLAPILLTFSLERWSLGLVTCKIVAHLTEILCPTALLFVTGMALQGVWTRLRLFKPSQVRLVTVFLWVSTVFLAVFLNIHSHSTAEFDPIIGTCSILNHRSLTTTRLVWYVTIYGACLLTTLLAAVALTVTILYRNTRDGRSRLESSLEQSGKMGHDEGVIADLLDEEEGEKEEEYLKNRNTKGQNKLLEAILDDDEATDHDTNMAAFQNDVPSIAPLALLFVLTWSPVLANLFYLHWNWELSPWLAHLLVRAGVALQVALSPILVGLGNLRGQRVDENVVGSGGGG